jgi:tRNA(Ile2) C34 agmatinyltransferase TiaS
MRVRICPACGETMYSAYTGPWRCDCGAEIPVPPEDGQNKSPDDAGYSLCT